jgi:SAM-dependent methyltransferase
LTDAHLNDELWAFADRWLPPPPARILDVGCGAGLSTRRFAAEGYEVLGLDPSAPDEPGFRRRPLEDLDDPDGFDAAVAIRSLHHMHHLDRAVEALAEALRPGSRLVVFEFAIEAVDGATLRWCDAHSIKRPPRPELTPEVIPLASVRAALEARFRPLAEIPTAYHALEAGRAELEPDERREIAAGRLLPAGTRLAYERTVGSIHPE